MRSFDIEAFKGCYVMQADDIDVFARTLADGFSQYCMFQYICGKEYNRDKMTLFWAVSIKLVVDNAICIADSKEANSVLIYVRPRSKEPNPLRYLKAGGLKMLCKMGLRSTMKLIQFDAEFKKIAKRNKAENDGYIMCFATKLDKQGQHYGKPLILALLQYLDMLGEGCYLETLKPTNVDLYKHFSFELKEQVTFSSSGLTIFAMHRQKVRC